MRSIWLIVPAAALLWWMRGGRTGPGVLAPGEPRQSEAEPRAWEHAGFRIRALARYEIRARLLARERYWLDAGAALAPYDVAVGWGPMSDQALLDQLWVSQGHRFYQVTQFRRARTLDWETILSHSANMHIAPASAAVGEAVRWTRLGRVIVMRGYLIEARRPGSTPWRSSLSRTDTGGGACELMWVEEFRRE